MAKAAQAAAAKKPAAPAKGNKAPAPSTAKVQAKAKGAAAAVNGATAAVVSLKQLAAGLAESQDMPKRHVWTAPLTQGRFDDWRRGRVRSCVRPVCAAHGRWP
jgi:hypothetical protein